MVLQPSEVVSHLGQSADTLEAAMRAAVRAEISETINRWKAQGCPPAKVARQIDGNKESEALLSGWTRLPWKLIRRHAPWEYAMAERLYRIAVEMAHAADEQNSGLSLHKGIDYFEIGFMQFHQGRYQEAAHNILVAVSEDTGAGWKPEDTFAARELRKYAADTALKVLRPAAELCRQAGLPQVTDAMLEHVTSQMCYEDFDPAGGRYYPVWLLWLLGAIDRTEPLSGAQASEVTGLRRFEALREIAFFYEAAMKPRLGIARGDLKDVVSGVVAAKTYIPSQVVDKAEWYNHTSYALGDPKANPSARLAAIKGGQFGLAASDVTGVFCSRAIFTLGLVRNVTHHFIDLSSTLVGTEYEWVQQHVLAAVLLSW